MAGTPEEHIQWVKRAGESLFKEVRVTIGGETIDVVKKCQECRKFVHSYGWAPPGPVTCFGCLLRPKQPAQVNK